MDAFILIILLLLMSLAFVVVVLTLAEIMMGIPRLLRWVAKALIKEDEDA